MRGSHCGSSSYDECAQEIRTGRTGQVYAGYRISYNRNGSVSFGTETWEYFGTLPGIARSRHPASKAAAQSTPRSVFEQLSAMQMLDVHFPTTDGRTMIFRRHTAHELQIQCLVNSL
jgi:hypothetical protein